MKTNGVRIFLSDRIRPPRGFSAPRLPRDRPLDLEIGCGSGWHSIRYARANPDRVLIAIERTRTRFGAFERRRQRHQQLGRETGNLLAVHADAVAWVTHALGPESIDRVILLYPNPYPKNSDRGKRWHAMPFMRRLIETLKPGGELRLVTNERFYSEEAGRFMREEWGLDEVEALCFSAFELPPQIASQVPRTHFEKKYLARGETCYERHWKKPVFNPRRFC